MASLNFKKYFQSSIKLDNGPPARYQLLPKRVNLDKLPDQESKIRKFTLGEKNPKLQNRTILLVGATGTGKSTLINALVNYVMGVRFEDKIWFEIIAAEKDRPQSESQTSELSIYEVFGFEGTTVSYSLTIIDTPGYGDTRGIDSDQFVTKKLEDLFCSPDGVDTVDAVGLVLKATENRLDDRMAYIFNSVTSLFGKNMEKNIVAMMTHSVGRKPKDALQALETAQIKCARNTKNEPVYFLFNNCQKDVIENDDDDEEDMAQDAFKKSEKSMLKFTDFLGNSHPQSLKTTVAVMKERIRLEACVQNLKERVKNIEETQMAITKNKEELSKYEEMIKKNEHFTFMLKETYKVKVKIDGWWDNKAVNCNKCEENCHYPGCTMALNPSWCEVMKDGKCTSCSGKCPVEHHVKEKWRYETKTRTVTKTIEEIKAKYEKSKDEKTTLLKEMDKEMADLQIVKNQYLDEAFHIIEQLERIALNIESIYTYIHLEYLIEKMEEKGDSEKVQKLKGMIAKVGWYVKAAAKYFKK